MSEIDILVKSIDGKFATRRGDVADSAALAIARLIKDVEGPAANPNEYKVLVAYQLLQPELDLEKIFNIEESSQDVKAKTITLDALEVKSGHYLIFIKPSAVATKLLLEINGDSYEVKDQDYSIGREDKAENIFPSLDLSPYLGQYERKVSRSLISFKEIEGKWKVFLEAKARTGVFIDGARLRHGEGMDIGDTINVGNSPEEPYLRIKTTIENK
ncbi:MAG: FHA domain-containing protein [Anaerolineales bacterium]|nr:FHA domain-containing protein [Anaerolineales bacterium]